MKHEPHVHSEIIKMWADGYEIQYKYSDSDSWRLLSPPSLSQAPAFFEDYQYRIKSDHDCYKVGDEFEVSYEHTPGVKPVKMFCILAQVFSGHCAMISLHDGNRRADPIEVEDLTCITEEELRKMISPSKSGNWTWKLI
jgi:hypothetical protein